MKTTKPKPIPVEWQTDSVEHRHGGNGWAVVSVNKDDWVDIVQTGKITPGSQIFHVWDKQLKAEGSMAPASLEQVIELRAKLASGEYVVKNTRLVKA